MTTTVRDRLQASLSAAYTIERELGGGGMSRVFVATDPALDRRVVVKVLAPDLAAGLSAERFAREIRLAAALQDPHIVPVLSAGSADGTPYYTMPFVEGESLRARMAQGPLRLDDALRLLRDVAEALEYAHARGVVHRDIKPENILLAGRNAVVADFGIAKALSAARGGTEAPAGATLTSVGMSLGTPAYMAPEQAVGDAADGRADIYAWGMVAYELLAGAHPFAHRTTPQQLVAAQLAEVPTPLDEARPGLPPGLGALVMRCLAKEPAERPASATVLLAALAGLSSSETRAPLAATPAGWTRRTWVALAVAVVVALAAGAFAYARRGAAPAAAATPSLAVLPFEHQGDSADVYLTDGITDEIRGKLTGVRNLVVIARGSSNQYRASKKTPREIAEELGVRYLLTGTVRVVGSGDARRVLVRPELVELTGDGRPQSRWQQPFDAPAADVIKVQSDIAGQVVSAMEVAVGGDDRAQLSRVGTADPVAYDLYLRAQAAWNAGGSTDPASLQRADTLLEQAVRRDTTLLEAWSALSRVQSYRFANEVPLAATAAKARAAADRARSLDASAAETHRARAVYLRIVENDNAAAVPELQRALAGSPNDADLRRNMALAEADLGRFDDALRDFDAAARLDPRSAPVHSSRARFLVRAGRIADARAAGQRARALAPASLSVLLGSFMVEVAAGDLPAARRVLADAERDIPRDRVVAYMGTYYDLGWVFGEDDARALLAADAGVFGGDSMFVAQARSQEYLWRGDSAAARTWAAAGVRAFGALRRAAPRDPQTHVLLGLMLATTGRSAEALASTERGLALADESAAARTSISNAYFQYVAARTAVLTGDRAKALAWLAEARRRHYYASPAWIRLDPSFAPLRGDPAFERVLAEVVR